MFCYTDIEVPAACIILIGLFALQHYGTHRVGFFFAPVILLWLMCISAIGVYNIFHWNPQVYQARFHLITCTSSSRKLKVKGGCLLVGSCSVLQVPKQCLQISVISLNSQSRFVHRFFSSLHFPSLVRLRSFFGFDDRMLLLQIAFTSLVYQSLILANMGQAAYLSQHHVIESEYNIGFYVSVPEKLRWPVLVIAILAAVVGSQAIITGTFSIIKQCSLH